MSKPIRSLFVKNTFVVPTLKLVTLVLSLILISPTAHAGKGDGVRGGGYAVEVRDVNQRPQFKIRDEISPATCDYSKGTELLAGNPIATEFWASLEKVNWYIAFELRREMDALFFCKTKGPIFFIPEPVPPAAPFRNEVTDVIPEPREKIIQAMYRIGRYVYFDGPLWEKFDTWTQLFYVTHETLHSYIPFNISYEEKRTALYSLNMAFAKLLQTNHEGKPTRNRITESGQLEFQIYAAKADFETAVDDLTPYKDQVQFLLSLSQDRKYLEKEKGPRGGYRVSDDQIDMLLNHPNHSDLLALDQVDLLNLPLNEWDKEVIKLLGSELIYKDAMKKALISANETQFQALLAKPNTKVNITQIAFDSLRFLKAEKVDYVFNSGVFQSSFSQLIDEVLGVNAVIVGKKAYMNNQFKALYDTASLDSTEYDPEFNKLMDESKSIVSIETSPKELSRSLRSLNNILAMFLKRNRKDLVESYFTKNDQFYSALNLENAVAKLSEASGPYEASVAIGTVKDLSTELHKLFSQGIRSNYNLKREQLDLFFNSLDRTKYSTEFRR
jgi:hypothetical protein